MSVAAMCGESGGVDRFVLPMNGAIDVVATGIKPRAGLADMGRVDLGGL